MGARNLLKSEESGLKTIKKTAMMRGMIVFHFAVTVALFLCCWIICYRLPFKQGEYFVHNRTIAASYILLLAVFSRIYAAYKVGIYRIGELVHGQFFANLMSWGITYFLACIMAQKLLNPIMAVICMIVQSVFAILWTVYMNRMYFRFHRSKRAVAFFCSRKDLKKIKELTAVRDQCHILKYFRCQHPEAELNSSDELKTVNESDNCEELIDDDIHTIMKVIDGYEAVFVAGVDANLRNGIVKHCVETKKECYFVPHTGDVLVAGATHMKAFSAPLFCVGGSHLTPEYLLVKRVFDILASGIALLILWPLMLIIALLIKWNDQGPAFYKQTRLTKDGKTFEMVKFRSMKVSAESDGIARLASENDDRITRVGKVIRATRIDELPQLINILKGDMSIVGPRPERPEIAEQYLKTIPAFNLRLQVKAGLTGYAQIYGRYNTEPDDKLKMDLMYINNMNVIEDLKLILATIQILFVKESTQGVRKETALKIENKPQTEKIA